MRHESEGRDTNAIDELLKDLAELRELDRRRQAHVPGSAAYDAATLEVDLRSRRLMDAFRDMQRRRAGRLQVGAIDRPLDDTRALGDTRPLDARPFARSREGSRLN